MNKNVIILSSAGAAVTIIDGLALLVNLGVFALRRRHALEHLRRPVDRLLTHGLLPITPRL